MQCLYLHGVHKPCPLLRKETMPAKYVHTACWSGQLLISLVHLFLNQGSWSLVWERDYVCAFIQNYQMVPYTTDSTQSVVNDFY